MKLAIKINLSSVQLIRLFLIMLFIITISWLSYFVYKNFYLTTIKINDIINLQKEVSLKNIKLDIFNKVKDVHNYKLKNLLPNTIDNAFGTTGTTVASSTTSVTPLNHEQ